MKRYQLKPGQESFQVVSGPFARRRYEVGTVYGEDQIPKNELGRFKEIKDKPAPATENASEVSAKPAKGGSTK